MARCECGALYVPSGKNVKITFKQGGLESHMYLEHEADALILDENKLVSYGNTTSQSISPSLVSISFDGPENLTATGMMKFIVRKGETRIVEKYFGTKDKEWVLPKVNGVPTITASCSDILNDVDISNSKIYVEIISVCDDSPGDCCGNSVSISFRNVINTICTVPVTTTPAPFIWRYSPNTERDNCIQDVNGRYLSYQECYDSLDGPDPDNPVTPTTSTTCDPNDPDCTPPPEATTTQPPNLYNWSVQQSFYPSGNGQMINNIAMSDDGTVIALEDTVGVTPVEDKHFRVMKLDSNCEWYQLGDNVRGNWSNVSMTANGSGVVGGNEYDDKVHAYEWNGSQWTPSGTPFFIGDQASIDTAEITPDGKHIVGSNGVHDSYRGTLEVYEWNGSDWSQKGVADEMLGNPNNRFSPDVCISDDGNIVLGCPYTAASSPRVKAWEWNGSNWTQRGQSIVPNVTEGEQAQTDITMMGDGSRITVGCGETDAANGSNSGGSIRIYSWNSNTSQWDLSSTIYGEMFNSRIGSDRSSSMSRDGMYLLITELGRSIAIILSWNGGTYTPVKLDESFNVETTGSWGLRTAMSQNGLIYAASTSASVSGVCTVVQSNNSLCVSVIPTTTPDPNVTTTTEDPNATTTTEEATTTTTTSAPDPNTPLPLQPDSNLTVVGGLFSEIRGGCFLKNGEYLGRYRYEREIIDGNFGDYCFATIEFIASTNQWMIYEGCDDNAPVTYSVAPPNGSSPWPPLTGWTNGYTLEVADCDEANFPDLTFNGGCLIKRGIEWIGRPLYSDSQQVLYVYFDGTQWVYGNIPSDGSIVYFTAPRIPEDDDFAPVTGWVAAPGYSFGTPSVSRSNCPDLPAP